MKGKILARKVSRELSCVVSNLSAVTLESKLLKPGKVYVLGRKDADLLIPGKKISREHVKFTLSEFPTSRVVSRPRRLHLKFIPIWPRMTQRSNQKHVCKTHATSL